MGKIINCFEDGRTEEDREFEIELKKYAAIEYRAPFLKIPIPMLRSNIFIQWLTSAKAQSWFRLYSYIIRAKMSSKMASHIYKKYYVEKHKLVARFTQESLAQSLGFKDRRAANNHIVKLEKDGVIKIVDEPWGNRSIRLYEFGTWSKTEDGKSESLHLFSTMRKLIGEKNLNEFLG